MSDLAAFRDILATIHGTDTTGYLRCFAGKRGTTGTIDKTTVEEVFFAYPVAVGSAVGWLKRRANAGKEVYTGVCLFREKKAAQAHAIDPRTLWIDGDTAPIPSTGIVPTILIASSPGRWQGYISLTRRIPVADAEALCRRYAYGLGGDRSGWDATQLLRVVGTPNYKYPGAPLVEAISVRDSGIYDPDDIDRVLPRIATDPTRGDIAADDADDDEPPVVLPPALLPLWRGERPVTKEGGVIDRSDTFFALAAVLHEHGATRRTIVAALTERDMVWGWGYGDAKPGDFDRIAGKVATKPRKVGPIGATSVNGSTDTATDDDDCAAKDREILRLRAALDQKDAALGERDETIANLRVRIQLADEQLAAHRNPKLGAAKATAAALIPLFRATPDKPNDPAGYRVPLDKLADATGLSPSACSRQLRQLATYTLDDGTPLLHHDVKRIPAGVDGRTGEIDDRPTNAHQEVWIGPGTTPAQWAAFVAGATPPERKPWGGVRDGRCADHPGAAVLKRTRDQRVITYECGECTHVLLQKVVPIGKPKAHTIDRIPPSPQDASMAPERDTETPPSPQLALSIEPTPPPRPVVTEHAIKLVGRELGATAEDWAEAQKALAWASTPPDRYTDITIGGKP